MTETGQRNGVDDEDTVHSAQRNVLHKNLFSKLFSIKQTKNQLMVFFLSFFFFFFFPFFFVCISFCFVDSHNKLHLRSSENILRVRKPIIIFLFVHYKRWAYHTVRIA